MAKITISVNSAKNGGNLYTLIDDLTNLNSQVSKTRDGNFLIVNDNVANPDQKVVIDQAMLLSILAEGGEVEEYLMAIRVPSAIGVIPVPLGLPWRTNALNEVRAIKDWFLTGAEIWIKDDVSEFVFYTNPAAGLASPSQYLKGSQIETLRQLDIVTARILTVSETQTLVATGWTKVVW